MAAPGAATDRLTHACSTQVQQTWLVALAELGAAEHPTAGIKLLERWAGEL